jgi:hypothetical protein
MSRGRAGEGYPLFSSSSSLLYLFILTFYFILFCYFSYFFLVQLWSGTASNPDSVVGHRLVGSGRGL